MTPGIQRQTLRRPGYDCVRSPCGRNGCGKRPGAGHGIHCEDWVYAVTDGAFALSLTVFSGVYPASVPADTVALMRRHQPCGADLSLHVGGPLGVEIWGEANGQECGWVDGKRCYQGCHYYTTASGADEFFHDYFRSAAGFDQPEEFWRALEAKLREWSDDVKTRRAELTELAAADRRRAESGDES